MHLTQEQPAIEKCLSYVDGFLLLRQSFVSIFKANSLISILTPHRLYFPDNLSAGCLIICLQFLTYFSNSIATFDLWQLVNATFVVLFTVDDDVDVDDSPIM